MSTKKQPCIHTGLYILNDDVDALAVPRVAHCNSYNYIRDKDSFRGSRMTALWLVTRRGGKRPYSGDRELFVLRGNAAAQAETLATVGAIKGQDDIPAGLLYCVWSYGYHWPLAVFDPQVEKWFFNGDKYSQSTSRHASYVSRGIGSYYETHPEGFMRDLVSSGSLVNLMANRLEAAKLRPITGRIDGDPVPAWTELSHGTI